MLLDVMNEPPEAGAVAVAALPPILKPEAVPVMFVPTNADGVPSAGVTNVGLVDNTTLPEPVEVVTPVPPRATDNVPVVPATIGSPVALVNVAADGVPRSGVVNDGEFKCVFCWATFVPSLHTAIVLPAGMATPVPAMVVLPVTVEL